MNKILPILKVDLTKYSSNDGEHLSWNPLQNSGTTPTNMPVTSQYIMYTSKSTSDTHFYKKNLDPTALTVSLDDLTLFETYLFQLVIVSNSTTYTSSNTLELRVNNTRANPCTITNIVQLDDAVMCDIVYGTPTGTPHQSITFILNDSSSIFSITRQLPTTPSTRFTLTMSDNALLTNYKQFEMSAFLTNIRGDSEFSNSVEFSASDYPNSPTLTSVVETDKSLRLSWQKPSDYALWFVESYTSLVHIQFKKSTDVNWIEAALLDTKTVDTLSYDITELENGNLYEIRVSYQNDVGLGQFSNVMTGMPFVKCAASTTTLFNLESDFIQIKAVLPDFLGGLDFVSCQIDIHENNNVGVSHSLVDTTVKSEYVFSLTESLKAYLFLQNRKYTFKVYVNTKSQVSNNKNIIKGSESVVENIVYYNLLKKKPEFTTFDVIASNNSIECKFTEVIYFFVPPVNILYTLFMDNVPIKTFTPNSVYTDMGNTTTWIDTIRSFVQTGLVNGESHTFTVTCSYNHAQFPSKSMPLIIIANKLLSSFDVSLPPTNLHVTNLLDTSLVLNWSSPPNFNGTNFKHFEVFQNDVLIFNTIENSVLVNNLVKASNYYFKVRTITERPELATQLFNSSFSESRETRTFTVPGSVVNITPTVLDRSVKINWNRNIDSGGYSVNRFSIRYKAESESDENYLEASNVISPATISGLLNGSQYQFQIFAHSYNNELRTTLTSLASTIFVTPLAVPSKPESLSVEPKDGFAIVQWQPVLNNGGTPLTKYILHIQNMTTNVVQMLDVNKDDLQISTPSLLNGTIFKIQLSAINFHGQSLKTSELYVVPFGPQMITNVVLFNKTINFSVSLNGEKVDDVSILAVDSSPSIDESLFLSFVNTSVQNSSSQAFSKSFLFSDVIQKYVIVVRSKSGQVFSTNFNTSMM